MLNRLLQALVLMTATCAAAVAADTPTGTLEIKLSGFQTGDGKVRIALYASAAAYNGGPMTEGKIVPANKGGVTVTFSGLAPGDYAIKSFHDVNENGELDTNVMGMPTEPYAFSNNARGQYGPAKWENARFTVRAGSNSQAITLE